MAPGVGCSVTFSRQGIWPLPARRGNFHQLRQIYFWIYVLEFIKQNHMNHMHFICVVTSPATGRKYEEEVGSTTLARSSSESPAVSIRAALLVFLFQWKSVAKKEVLSQHPYEPFVLESKKFKIKCSICWMGWKPAMKQMPIFFHLLKNIKVPEVFAKTHIFKLKYLKLTDHL